MKKFKKITACLLSVVTALSALTAFSVNAEETTEEKLYTLEELFAMSEEEFLALGEDAWGFHYEVKSDAEYFIQVSDITAYGGISGNVFADLHLEDEGVKYTANITEKEISALLGDTVEYNIDSPISLDVEELLENNLYYGNLLWISFPEYEVYAGTNDISDEEILEFAKCCYCVNQVIEVNYSHYGDALLAEPSDEEILIEDTTDTVTTLPNTLEQLVSKDGTFSNNEMVYSDRYKFAIEYGDEDDYYDTLIIYGIPKEDCANNEWENHLVFNMEQYAFAYDIGIDRDFYSGLRWSVACADSEFKLEKPLQIYFFINGEAPYYFDSIADASEAYGFNVGLYVCPNEISKNVYAVPENAVPTKIFDANDDSYINAADIVAVNLFLLNRDAHPLTDTQIANANCIVDDIIDSSDSTYIMNTVAMLYE